MKNQRNRSMKVHAQSGYNYKATPTIILKGQWLQEMGFEIGDYISVSCEDGKLIITPDAEKAAIVKAEAEFMDREMKKLQKKFQKEKEMIHTALHQRVFSFVYVNDILGLIWITGAVILVLKYIGEYIKLQKFISSIPSVEDERIKKVLSKVVSTQVPRVVKTGTVSIPCCFGIFKQTVILPDIKYSDEELYYILLHECSHLRNKDILTKALTNILCALYWWNPLVYLLKKDLNQSLEIRCDGIVARKLDKEKRADYLSVMLKLFKDSGSSNELKKYDSSMMQLFEEHSEKMIERFKLVAELKDGRSLIGKLVAWLLAGMVLVLSYSYIIQPHFEPPKSEIEVDEYAHEVNSSNSYIIKKKDGSYVLHTEYSEEPIKIDNIEMLKNDGFRIIEE